MTGRLENEARLDNGAARAAGLEVDRFDRHVRLRCYYRGRHLVRKQTVMIDRRRAAGGGTGIRHGIDAARRRWTRGEVRFSAVNALDRDGLVVIEGKGV